MFWGLGFRVFIRVLTGILQGVGGWALAVFLP